MADLIQLDPKLFAFTILAGVAPALFWLWFWLKEDGRRPEPKKMIGRVFILGGLAVALASVLEHAAVDPADLANPTSGGTGALLGVVLLLALIEEGAKLLAAYWGAFRSPYFDEPVDAMIYLVTAALGFAAVENILFMLSALGTPSRITLDFLLTGNFRFLGASVIHVVSSALIGGVIGLTFYRRPAWRVLAALGGLAGAIWLHAMFNYFIIRSAGSELLTIFTVLWLAALLILLFFEKVKNQVLRVKINLLAKHE